MGILSKLFFVALLFVFCISCASFEDFLILDEGPAYPDTLQQIQNYESPQIQVGDILYITVESKDETGMAVTPFNRLSSNGLNPVGNLLELTSYLVDNNGKIDFPILGTVHATERTTTELKTQLEARLLEYLKVPVVSIRYLNFDVNIIGEVMQPGVFRTTNERMTIMEAISLAGGLTSVANNTNIQIIREINGYRKYGTINLKSREVFSSPYYYLRQNDVIYIEPLETKITQVRDPAQRVFPWVSLGISTITFLIAVFGQ